MKYRRQPIDPMEFVQSVTDQSILSGFFGRKHTAWTVSTLYVLLGLGGLGTTPVAHAQTNGLGGVELSVVERYKGRIAEASKLSEQPNTFDTLVQTRPQQYRVPTVPLQFELDPPPLKPLLVSKVQVPKLPNYHLDLGAGNNGLFLTHLTAASGRSSKQQWGAEFDHRSYSGGVPDNAFDDQNRSQTRLQGHLKKFTRSSVWSGSAAYDRQGFRYYGFPEALIAPDSTGFPEEAERQIVHRVELGAGWSRLNPQPQKDQFDRSTLDYGYLSDRFGNRENRLAWEGGGHFDLAGQRLDLDGTFDFFRTDFDSVGQQSRSFAQFGLKPTLVDQWGELKFSLGIDVGYNATTFNLSGTDRGGFYLLPNFKADYTLVPGYLSAFADWTGSIDNLSYHELNRRFDFLYPTFDQETTRQSQIRLGLRGRITHRWVYEVSGHFADARKQALLYRDPLFSGPQGSGFGLLYDAVSRLGFEGSMGYETPELSFRAVLNYDAYETDRYDAAYHLPALRLSVDADYEVHPKIRLEASMRVVGSRLAYEEGTAGLLDRTLDPFVDLGLGGLYHYNEALSARLRFDNGLFQSYDLTYGYGAQRFMASLTLGYRF